MIGSYTIYAESTSYPPNSASYQPMSSAGSPAPSVHEHIYSRNQNSHMSPDFSPAMAYSQFPQQPDYLNRRSSISSFHSKHSHDSPMSGSAEFDEDGNQKGRCPNPDCGREFKDLKAHMLTHQPGRFWECPFLDSEYNQKGFNRKYDKTRHALTHYKGTMVCCFCPGSGSAAEKSFNRADVFKRHLTNVHGVEQTPPNSHKRNPTSSNKKATSNCQDAIGKCSICSTIFSNAQDFYEHLDDCVLRAVQQEEPKERSEAIQHGTDIEENAYVGRFSIWLPDTKKPDQKDTDTSQGSEDFEIVNKLLMQWTTLSKDELVALQP
jgi:hypothetical protein